MPSARTGSRSRRARLRFFAPTAPESTRSWAASRSATGRPPASERPTDGTERPKPRHASAAAWRAVEGQRPTALPRVRGDHGVDLSADIPVALAGGSPSGAQPVTLEDGEDFAKRVLFPDAFRGLEDAYRLDARLAFLLLVRAGAIGMAKDVMPHLVGDDCIASGTHECSHGEHDVPQPEIDP